MKLNKYLPLLIYIVVLCALVAGCATSRMAVKEGYDFNKVKRIGVMDFIDFQDTDSSGEAVADEFVRQLMKKKFDVIERSQLDALLAEQSLRLTSEPDLNTLSKAGKELGIDLFITGTVTKYFPDRSYIVVLGEETDDYTLEDELKTHTLITDAEVGVSARMVDVESGFIVWSNVYTYSSLDIETSIEWVVADLLMSLKNVWPRMGSTR